MLPWGHAAVGYLLYTALVHYRDDVDGVPAGAPVLALAIGTQFADLVDKPLAWYLGILDSGRSLGHSLLTAVVLLAVVHWLATRYGRRELSVAFAVGHLSHLAADALYPLLRGEWAELGFLLWPVLSRPGVEVDRTVTEVIVASTFSPTGLFELALFVAATALWLRHGAPGLVEFRRGVRWSIAGTVATLRRLTP